MSSLSDPREDEEEEQPTIEDVEKEPIKRDKLPQKDYYGKWDSFAKETVAELDDEEEQEKKQADEKLGKTKYAMSDAERKDKETHEKLKAAKKALDKRREMDEAAKYVWSDKTDEKRVFSQEDLQGKRVLVFKNCKGCSYELPESLVGLIKVFVEHCDQFTLTVACKLITSHMEISHCNDISVSVERNELHTVQVDLCDTVTIRYAEGLFHDRHRVFSAGMRNMTVTAEGGKLESHSDFIRDLAPVVLHAEERNLSDPKSEEQHFITQMVDGELITEVAVQMGDRWVTRRELDLENVSQAQISQRQQQEMKERAERDKRAGNQAFQGAEYAQAAVHYTTAIDNAISASEVGDPLPLLHVCYSNRAACFLKLGQPERAVEDCDECIKLNPEFVKGHFRKGMALHAMGRYQEALPVLGTASRLELPKNKTSLRQINEAIKFAEAKLASLMRQR